MSRYVGKKDGHVGAIQIKEGGFYHLCDQHPGVQKAVKISLLKRVPMPKKKAAPKPETSTPAK